MPNHFNIGELQQVTASATPHLNAIMAQAMDPAAMRMASPLRDETQAVFDNAITEVARERLQLVDALINARLITPLPQWFSITELRWERISDQGEVTTTMSPNSRLNKAVPDIKEDRIPIPMNMIEVGFNPRTLAAAQRTGQPIEDAQIRMGARRLNEAVESIALNGLPASVAGYSVPGFLNTTYKESLTGMTAWDDASKTGAQILTDTINLMNKLRDINRRGPFLLFIPPEWDYALDEDFKDESSQTIRGRLLDLPDLQSITPVDHLRDETGANFTPDGVDNSGKCMMIEARSDNVDVIVGAQNTELTYEGRTPFDVNTLMYNCIVPRIKRDYNDKAGIVVGTT